ncbi:MAG: ferredoxin-NAD(P)+ reductase (naphthalene dioxygenase ferredoxin-specific) [Alphaproteobacteria bacterium]|jgi:ferredoxin-NAD(P)+ reductase (naphthalene dioxygenase ferredoxin-specific)
MSFAVIVRQFDAPLDVEMGDTILQTALNAGRQYPHGCQSGNCGACKSRLYSGDVAMSPYSEYALTDAEKDSGLILACRSVPWSDCEVAYLEQDEVVAHPLRKLTCTVRELDRMTHDTVRLRLSIEAGGPFDFTAGQFSQVSFDGLPPRDYSMANRPGDALLEFHIRQIADGTSSAYANTQLQVGDTVHADGPHGISYYRAKHTGPIVALAGGSGLAPIKSIVEEALAQGAAQPIYLYFGVRDTRDLYLEEHFRDLAARHANLTFIPVLSEPSGATAHRTGYLADVVAADFADLDGAKVYLAGPPIMVETCVEQVRERGVGNEDCHADAFYTEADKARLEAAP